MCAHFQCTYIMSYSLAHKLKYIYLLIFGSVIIHCHTSAKYFRKSIIYSKHAKNFEAQMNVPK